MKPKEYLLSIGAISEIGRGRLSVDNIAKVKQAVSEGIVIEGYSVSTPASAPVKEVTKTPKVQSDKVPLHPLYRYNLNDTVIDADGKRHSIKAACQNSGYSIIGCNKCDRVHRIVSAHGTMSVDVTVERN